MKKFLLLVLSVMLLVFPVLTLAEEAAAPVPEAEAAAEVVEAATQTVEAAAEGAEAAAQAPLPLLESLSYMLKGMVGIFLVTGLIILVLFILERATKGRKAE